MKIAIVDYNCGNTKSVQFALDRLGAESVLTSDAGEIESAGRVILPGVGTARTAMNSLIQLGLDSVIKNLKQPVLGICLGMQIMCGHSDELNTECLGIFDQQVRKFAHGQKTPQVGWNTNGYTNDPIFGGLAAGDYMYFVHSYFVPLSEHTIASSLYGRSRFSSAIRKDNFIGVQFHPEKSSLAGEIILRNFIEN